LCATPPIRVSRVSKFRMSFPKSEDDLRKIVEEISQQEEEEYEHHHHHHEHLDELVIAVNALIDAVNTLSEKISRLENRVRSLEKQSLAVAKLQGLALKLQISGGDVKKEEILSELTKIIEEIEKKG